LLKAGVAHHIFVDFCNVRAPADGDEDEAVMDSNPGLRLGGAEVRDQDDLINEAVEAAKSADVVIAVVGLNADWETEGYDRTTLALPGRTDELIEKVVEANRNTVVVTQAVRIRRLTSSSNNWLIVLCLFRAPPSPYHGQTKYRRSSIHGTWVTLLATPFQMSSWVKSTPRANSRSRSLSAWKMSLRTDTSIRSMAKFCIQRIYLWCVGYTPRIQPSFMVYSHDHWIKGIQTFPSSQN
jgi:hypothetical protein